MPHTVHVGRSGYPAPVAVSGPSISVVVSRLTGVAPLAVFFDASGTTDTTTTFPFHELGYEWDFGDPGSGNWGTTGFSKNSALGPEAAHVFEDPDTYTVTLTVTNGVNVSTAQYTIVVSDADTVFSGTNTTAVGATTLPVAGVDGVPLGAFCVIQSNWPTIVSAYATAGKRVLLKHDDIFTGAATAVFNTGTNTVGTIIGMYGSGAKPKIRTTSVSNGSSIMSLPSAGGTCNNLVVMDLDIDGQSDVHRNAFHAASNYTLSQLLFLRVDMHDLGGAFLLSVTTGVTPVVPDQVFVVDSTVARIKGTAGSSDQYGIFISGTQVGVMGNDLDDTIDLGGTAQHLLRANYIVGGVFSHNEITNAHSGKEMFAIRGANPAAGSPFPANAKTRYVVASYNLIEMNTFAGITVDNELNTPAIDIWDIIIESNFFTRTVDGLIGVRIRATQVTARNNVYLLTPGTHGVVLAIVLGDGALGAGASYVWLFNNSGYSGGTQTAYICELDDDSITNLFIRNNILYKPAGAAPTVVVDNGTNNTYTQSNNLLTNPTFVVTPPVTAQDFALGVGSVAIDAGYAVPVQYDYNGDARPSGVAIDEGAFET